MATIYQMTLAECRKECERLATRANEAEKLLGFIRSTLSEEYSDVILLERRVEMILKELGQDAESNQV